MSYLEIHGFIAEFLDKYENIYLSGSFIQYNFDKKSDIDIIVLGNRISRDFHQYVDYKGLVFDIVHVPKERVLRILQFDSLFFGGVYNNMFKNAIALRDNENFLMSIQNFINKLEVDRSELDNTDSILQNCFTIKEQLIDLERSENELENTLIINSILDSVIHLELLTKGSYIFMGKWKAYSLKKSNKRLFDKLSKLITEYYKGESRELVPFLMDYLNEFDQKYTLHNSTLKTGLEKSNSKINSYLIKNEEFEVLIQDGGFFSERFYVDFLNDEKIRDNDILIHLYGEYDNVVNKYEVLSNKFVYKKKLTLFLGGVEIENIYFNKIPQVVYEILKVKNRTVEERFEIGILFLTQINISSKHMIIELLIKDSLYQTVNKFKLLNEGNYEEIEYFVRQEACEFLSSYEEKLVLSESISILIKTGEEVINTISILSESKHIEVAKVISYLMNYFRLTAQQKYILYMSLRKDDEKP